MRRISLKDRRVIEAFLAKKPLTGHKLTTDGHSLDGLWMGGKGIVLHAKNQWEGGFTFPDLGSKSAQLVQNLVIKMKG